MTQTKSAVNKLMSQVFAPVNSVVWDLMSNATGVKRNDGIYTLGNDDQIDLNPFDAFSMELPAFSQLVPVDQVKRGDVIVTNSKPTGWVLETKTTKAKEGKPAEVSIQALSFEGHQTRFRPKNVKMMGMNGVTVVRSPFNFHPNESGEQTSGMGDMASMLPLLMLSGKGSGDGIDAKTMMLMSMMGGGAGFGGATGGMNPMLMMALMGDDNPFQSR